MDGIVATRSNHSTGIIETGSYTAASIIGPISGLCRTIAEKSADARYDTVLSIYHIPGLYRSGVISMLYIKENCNA